MTGVLVLLVLATWAACWLFLRLALMEVRSVRCDVRLLRAQFEQAMDDIQGDGR